ncbi:hypothetical protein [Chthonobacter albigriseus]|uniref:hypothetical protein n=1 Tax=Chthonobacter albigriseus TaxID=1683161 RepID=UPI0015EEE2AC|nr:hypothetical protein [Chthonobacter albigriseus]
MPLQNRVTPFGEFEATSARGTLMGNRGILHDDQQRLGRARWKHKHWVACALSFKGRKRPLMAPHAYTELFFCDEAVSLAAGHRPCSECRKANYERFVTAWRKANGDLDGRTPRAGEIDTVLHKDRLTPERRKATSESALGLLPPGTFIALPDEPSSAWLVGEGAIQAWSHAGYGEVRITSGTEMVTCLTPASTVRALAAGYRPALHPTARVIR